LNKVISFSTVSKGNIIDFKEEKELIKFVLKNHSWTHIKKYKKYISKDHCRDVIKNHYIYQKKWNNISSIYKITYLPNKLFTYYGSYKNIGTRFKYHYYNSKYHNNFLGFFKKAFGWHSFFITLIE